MARNVKSFGKYYRKVMDKPVTVFTKVHKVTKWIKKQSTRKKVLNNIDF